MDTNLENSFQNTLENLQMLINSPDTNFPQDFVSFQEQKKSFEEIYALTLEDKNLKKFALEKNLRDYNTQLEIAQNELLRQEKLLSELYKTLARNILVLL